VANKRKLLERFSYRCIPRRCHERSFLPKKAALLDLVPAIAIGEPL
jgi:hypothetical protein